MIRKQWLLVAIVGAGVIAVGNPLLGQGSVPTKAPGTNAPAAVVSNNATGLSPRAAGNLEVQPPAKLKAQVQQMESEGKLALNMRRIANSGQQLVQKSGWMDVEFLRINNLPVQLYLAKEQQRTLLAFQIKDQNGDYYGNCFMNRKAPLTRELMKLKRGDRVRLIGQVVAMVSPAVDSENDIPWFRVASIEMIKPAAK